MEMPDPEQRAALLTSLAMSAPEGCWLKQQPDGSVEFGATMRSTPDAVRWLVSAVLWGVCISPIVYGYFASMFMTAFGPLPKWMPLSSPGAIPVPTSTSAAVAAFVLVGIMLTPMVLYSVLALLLADEYRRGEIKVSIAGDRGLVLTSPALVRRRQVFDASRVDRVERHLHVDTEGAARAQILIHADKKIWLGSKLSAARMRWMIEVFKCTLRERSPEVEDDELG